MFQFVYLVPVVIYYLVVLNICSSLYISFHILPGGLFVPVCIYSSCCYILPGGFKHLFQIVYIYITWCHWFKLLFIYLPGGFKHLFQFVYLVPVVIYYLVVLNICSSLYILPGFETCCYILPGGFKHLFQIVYIVPVVIYYLVFLNIGSSLYI